MIPFLKSVAKAYTSRYIDLSDFCFVFPNKRSGTFFLKYLQEENSSQPIFVPEVTSISDFVSHIARRVPASRLDLIFILYQCYQQLKNKDIPDMSSVSESSGATDTDEDFDAFLTWGETVLSDFDDVDRHLVDPDEIFKNLKDFREIASNFLTEEQKKVMAEYFGRNDYGDPNKFWKNFDNDNDNSESKKRFLELWRTLAPLYHLLKEKLEIRKLSTPGGVYRTACETLEREGRNVFKYSKIVFVGFNALSTAEHTIFSLIQKLPPSEGHDSFADFFWDATGPVLTAGTNSASKFVKAGINSFPCPEWALPYLHLSDTDTLPSAIDIYASPSNSIQTKIAGSILDHLLNTLNADDFKEAKVAVVLPDENLLLPMLYSLPKGIGGVNLTMGYPLRITPAASFMTLLRRLLFNIRTEKGQRAVYHRSLRTFLSHPLSHLCFSSAAIAKAIGYLDRSHRQALPISELSDYIPLAAQLLCKFDSAESVFDTISAIQATLDLLTLKLSDTDNTNIKTTLEKSHVETYRDAIRRLSDIFTEYQPKVKSHNVFRLLDRLITSEKVGFEGEPLSGLQVMGTLETRSLDFDHIIVLSVNERILPMRARARSFIPNSLRHAYAMPPTNYAEGIFAYYFFRMMSRANSVSLIYDGRAGGGLRTGGESRYIHQLRHLYAPDKITETDCKFILAGKKPHNPSIEITPSLSDRLQAFITGNGDRNISASALISYRSCPLLFLYKNVLGIDTDPAPSEFIDAITAGNILHKLMLILYLPEEKRRIMLSSPFLMTAKDLSTLIADRSNIWKQLTRLVNKEHFHLSKDKLDTPLSGSAELIARKIEAQAIAIMQYDRSLAPFAIHGCEIEDTMTVTLKSGIKVNFKFAIDRLDEIIRDGVRTIRIIDYKTGSLHLEADDIDDIFHGDYQSSHLFQLSVYAWLLRKYRPDFAHTDIRLEIYNVAKINEGGALPKIDKKQITSYSEFQTEFEEGIDEMIQSIFSSDCFEATSNEKTCALCNMKFFCRR